MQWVKITLQLSSFKSRKHFIRIPKKICSLLFILTFIIHTLSYMFLTFSIWVQQTSFFVIHTRKSFYFYFFKLIVKVGPIIFNLSLLPSWPILSNDWAEIVTTKRSNQSIRLGLDRAYLLLGPNLKEFHTFILYPLQINKIKKYKTEKLYKASQIIVVHYFIVIVQVFLF